MGWQVDIPPVALAGFDQAIVEQLATVAGDPDFDQAQADLVRGTAVALASALGAPFCTASLSGHRASPDTASTEGETGYGSVGVSVSGAAEPQL